MASAMTLFSYPTDMTSHSHNATQQQKTPSATEQKHYSHSSKHYALMITFNPELATQLAIGSVFAIENKQQLLAEAIQHSIANHQQWYETLLQTYLFAGFPCALQALSTLHTTTNIANHHHFSYDTDQFTRNGEHTCQTIYGSVYNKLRATLQPISPELDASMIIEGYGKILSRPQLPLLYREIAIVAMLRHNGWQAQNISHTRGALRLGIDEQQLETILRQCFHHTTHKGIRPPFIQE